MSSQQQLPWLGQQQHARGSGGGEGTARLQQCWAFHHSTARVSSSPAEEQPSTRRSWLKCCPTQQPGRDRSECLHKGRDEDFYLLPCPGVPCRTDRWVGMEPVSRHGEARWFLQPQLKEIISNKPVMDTLPPCSEAELAAATEGQSCCPLATFSHPCSQDRAGS